MDRPTSAELDALTDAYRRDPGGSFAPLASAYLALGRPREALDVVRSVMATAPTVEGHVLAGRAFAELHQWKESQVELLKVVKADRNHAEGFSLLGEVLMRRGDFERALPVLQHAHNLNPANPSVLAMVKRARNREELDPPLPIPTPVELSERGMPSLPAVDRSDIENANPVVPSGIDDGADFGVPVSASRSRAPRPDSHPPQSAPPEPPTGVRPRVFAPDKRKDAAKESLRESASVGEDYLNQLLTHGLLEFPNVRVSPPDPTVPAGQKWGRSAKRTFIFLFAMMFLAIGSGGGWYYYTEKQKAETIAQLLARARIEAQSGSYEDLQRGLDNARSALDLDLMDSYSVAALTEVMGLSSYLYGSIPPAEVELGVETAANQIGPEDPGSRELLLARALATLAQLSELENAESRLAEVRNALRAYLAGHSDDTIARWVSGRAMLAAGDRQGAEAAFEQAAARGQGTVLAAIDRADMLLDDGKLEQAATSYDEILKKSPNHPLACIGRSFSRSERSMESAEAIGDLNVCVSDEMGPRVTAYKQLAMAFAHHFIEDYDDFNKNLVAATGVGEPRFQARVALAQLLRGDVISAGKYRASIQWYAGDPDPHPLVSLVDAELYYATGDNQRAMSIVEKMSGMRAMTLRGKVYWDRSEYEHAAEEFRAALEIGPEDMEAQVYLAAVEMTTARGSERKVAEGRLDKLGRQKKSKLPRHVYGEALIRDGLFSRARDEFEKALAEIGESAPHPLAYRSHIALAELDARAAAGLSATNPEEAAAKQKSALEHLNAALKQNPSNLLALDLAGRLLASRDPDQAMKFLISVVDSGAASPLAELAYAKILAGSKHTVDREKAEGALKRALEKGAPMDEVARVALLVGGTSLAATLVSPGVLQRVASENAASPGKPRRPQRRRRRRR